MGRKFSKRNKASLGFKFRAHIRAAWYEIKVFVNNSTLCGPCGHHVSRYVYNRTSEKKLIDFFNQQQSIGKISSEVDFDTWRQQWKA